MPMTRPALKIAIPPRDDHDTTLLDSDTKRNLIALIVQNINSEHAHRIDTLLHQIHRQATLETELANYMTPHDQTQRDALHDILRTKRTTLAIQLAELLLAEHH